MGFKFKLSAIVAAISLGVSVNASAVEITGLYGDIDAFGSGLNVADVYSGAVSIGYSDMQATAGDAAGTDQIIDTDLSFSFGGIDVAGLNVDSVTLELGLFGLYSDPLKSYPSYLNVGGMDYLLPSTESLAADADSFAGIVSIDIDFSGLDLSDISSWLFTVDAIFNNPGNGESWALDYAKFIINGSESSTSVPEPITLSLFGFGLALMGLRKRKV